MSTLGTAFPLFSKEGESPLNSLKKGAKTTAKINVQEIILLDELRPSWRSHLKFHAFRSRPPIREQQQLYTSIRSPEERDVLPPEAVVRKQLDWYSDTPNKEKAETFFTLRSAWDALAYDRYEIGSKEEGLAGSVLQAYYSATHEPTIKLSDPRQVWLLDALTEAAGIPHQRGQTEVQIPEKLRNYTKYQMSAEYQTRWAQAQAKRIK